MTELTDRLKLIAEDIYAQSDECDNRNDAMKLRRHLLGRVHIQERWMVKEYVAQIGRDRQRKAIRGLHRGDTAVAIDKGRMDTKNPARGGA